MMSDRYGGQVSPITWFGSFPVYLATILAMAHGVALVLVAFLAAFGGNTIIQSLIFIPAEALFRGAIWQFVTYAFVSDPRNALWVAIQLVMLAVFGRDVEMLIGRRAFAWMYAALVVAGPVLVAALSLVGIPGSLAGAGGVHFAVFVAFAAIYPRAEIFFGIQARWIALGLFVINAIQHLAGTDFVGLAVLFWECAVAIVWLAMIGAGGFSLPELPRLPLRRKPRLKLVAKPEPDDGNIDAILEKISREGLSSLTRSERARLEKAREALLEKERPS
jgi:hypothetical protein